MQSGAFGRFGPAALAAFLSACSSGYSETEAARLIESTDHPSPEVRNVTYPKPGLTCGEVRWLNLHGHYNPWEQFHIRNHRVWVADFVTPTADNPMDPRPDLDAFRRAHVDCEKPRRKEGAELIVEGRR